jgi:hypothetical protein
VAQLKIGSALEQDDDETSKSMLLREDLCISYVGINLQVTGRDHGKSDVLQLLQHCDGDIQGKQGSGIKRSVSETDLSM